ncbi:SDR family NAD(P)-dependent oxidoreductase [Bacteroides sp. 51]|uniref:SDR family NAD(P)-dependent oxidoreductase n=1 Tax=Bacteroides sp. 51 TaxID=2302938 RepID=UPI0013CF71BC|nr:SDR family NAD(P)-dependent oxidoreductase [Bacteroides sp. 51]NDV82656.1 SDR family NAD(P)-dependent oxidoreductase [Bacteroides sp. 51]
MKQQIILLTGGSSGIGLEVAKQLMNRGARIYSASRRIGTAQKALQGGGEIIPVQLDINNEEETNLVINRILQESQRIDAVICNAGNGLAGSVEDTSADEVRYQLETNFFGTVKTINACLPVFRKQGYGKIMSTSSVAAIVPIPYQAFYSAGKSALLTFMQALSMEVKPFGIQCCTVLPGDTKTEFTSARKYTEASQLADSAYTARMKKSVEKMVHDEENGMSASFVARKMTNQIMSKRMKSILIPGVQYKLICWLFNVLPVRLRLWCVGQLY